MPSESGGPERAWEQEAERAIADRLAVLLPGLVGRRVPVRAVDRGPLEKVGRLRMADGTTLLVAGLDGGLARVARALHERHAVVLTGWSRGPEGVVVTLGGVSGRTATHLRVRGLDQPD